MPSLDETPRSAVKVQNGKPLPEAAVKSLETLRQITTPVLEEAAVFDEGAALVALGAVLDAVRLRHGALLVYDGDRQSLSLLAQQGLSEAAQAAIRLVRRGVAGVWDMPLHSLLQRRVYIIDRPKENPFVPPLLDGTDQNLLSNLAFIPLYSGGKASGVVLLVGSGARMIREPDILALREHAKILGAVLCRPNRALARGEETTPSPAPASDAQAAATSEALPSALARDRAALAARVAELEALVDSLWTAGESKTSAETERQLAEVTHERDRLKADLASREFELLHLRSEQDLQRQKSLDEAEKTRQLGIELAQAREQVASLRDREHAASQEKDRLDRVRAELEARLRDAEQRVAETVERSRRSETEFTNLASQLGRAEKESAELREALAARERQVEDLRTERERLASSLHGTASRAQESQVALAHFREDADQSISTLERRTESLEARLQETERERDQLRAASTGREAVVQEIERETETIRGELAREIERRRAAEETYASVIRDASELHTELERAAAAQLEAKNNAEKARTETERLSQELARLRADHQAAAEASRTDLASARSSLVNSERERETLAQQVKRLQGDLTAVLAREETLQARGAAQEVEAGKLRAEVLELRKAVEAGRESAQAAIRERDAAATRSTALDDRIAALLRESESAAADRHRLDEEIIRLRAANEERNAEIARLRAEAEAAAATAVREALKARKAADEAEEARRAEFERQAAELRAALERSQALGSELTAEIESGRKIEAELRAADLSLRSELKERQEQLRAESEERGRLASRLSELEEVLRGAARDLPAHAQELDAAAALRATLDRSEAARRAAEEAVDRLQSAIEGERLAREAARADAEDQRRAARDLAAEVEQFARRLEEAESSAATASRRIEALSAEHAAATETAQSLAADLGRRTAELGELKDRLVAVEHQLEDSRSSREQAQARIQALDEAARLATLEITSLKRQIEIAAEDKRKLIHESDVRLAEAKAHEERLAADLATANEERQRAEGTIRSFDAERGQVQGELRAAETRRSEAEAALARSRAEGEQRTTDLESQRRKIQSLEDDLRTAGAESSRWQTLGEKLQATIAERDREIVALRAASTRPADQVTVAAKPTEQAEPRPAARPAAAPTPPAAAKPPAPARRRQPSGERMILIFDQSGPSLESMVRICKELGVEPRTAQNGSSESIVPELVAVNLLSTAPAGLQSLFRCRTEESLLDSPIVVYAAQPGSAKGLLFVNVDCVFHPIEEDRFKSALATMIRGGKRVTIIGEDLEGVLRLNSWATSSGCSVSSAGDPKQGSELLDIVKPDLIVLDLPRLSGEGAALIVKVRRSTRLQGLPILLLLPPKGTSPTAGLFLKRLAALVDETPLDLSPLSERLSRVA